MLLDKLLKSFFNLILMSSSAVAFGQAGSYYRGHSSEQIPNLVVPQESSIMPRNPYSKINRILINSVQWSPAGEPDDFNIYPDLSFDFIRKYNFKIIPSLRSNGQQKPLPDGYYYLRVAIFKPKLIKSLETFGEMSDRYITGIERVVHAENGVIATPVTFSFPLLSSTTMKNRMLLEIVPLQQKPIKMTSHLGKEVVDLKTSQFIADTSSTPVLLTIPFAPLQNGDSINTVDNTLASDISYNENFDIGALMYEGVRKLNEKINARVTPTPKKWAAKNKVKLVYSDDLYRSYENFGEKEELCQRLEKNLDYVGPTKFKATTTEVRARQTIKNFCQNEKNTVIFQKIQFINPYSEVDLINGDGMRRGSTSQLVVSLTRGNNSSRSNDQVHSLSGSLSLNPLDYFGMGSKIPGLSLNRGMSFSEVTSQSQFHGGVMAENVVLEVRRLTLNIQASNTRSCYILQLNQNHKFLQDKLTKEYLEYFFGKERNWGAQLVCQNTESPAIVQEHYFHILPAFNGQGIADSNDPRNQLINMSLRGYQEFNLFKHQIRQSIADQYQSLIMPTELLNSSIAAETMPGVHISKSFTDTRKPTLFERWFVDKEHTNFN